MGTDTEGPMATEVSRLTPTQQVIIRVLQEFQKPAYRTELVKFVYFTDYIYYQHAGRTLTGLGYMWDQHGPNAISGEIVREADQLSARGIIRMKSETTYYGDSAYLYSAQPESPRPPLADAAAEFILKDVVQKYGRLGPRNIAAASKKTAPFKHARPGDILNFDIGASFYATSPEPRPVSQQELEAVGTGRSIAQLRQKYGL